MDVARLENGRWVSLGSAPTAADGEEALARYERGPEKARRYDVVILDLTVRGGLGGEETMRRLLRLDADARGIVASGYGNSPVMAHHTDYGFRAVLRKPFEVEAVAHALRQALGARLSS